MPEEETQEQAVARREQDDAQQRVAYARSATKKALQLAISELEKARAEVVSYHRVSSPNHVQEMVLACAQLLARLTKELREAGVP